MARQRVGRYEIIRELGRGATAVVYLARHALLGKEVALKELDRSQAADTTVAERFLREAQLASSLTHPNIVTVYDYFPHRGRPYIAMEYLERGSLRPLVGRLEVGEILTVLDGLLDGLAYAETKDLVHRDLKPENLMLTDTGSIKITDFGIAKAYGVADDKGKLTQTGTVVGAPAYMSPEQATGRGAGPLADLYAVGVIAYELVTGVVPFSDDEAMAILWKHVHEPVPPVRTRRPDVDERLADWIERLLAKDPGDRPQGAAQAWEDLEPVADDLRPRRWQATTASPSPSGKKWRALVNPLNVGVPLAMLAIGIAIGAFWLVPVALVVFGALVFISVRESSVKRTR